MDSNYFDMERFGSKDFDPMQQLWDALPDNPEQSRQCVPKLLSQALTTQNRINTQMYSKVVAQHAAMETSKTQIIALADVLKQAKGLCASGRDGVREAKTNLVVGGLHVLALNKRREAYLKLASTIQNIKKILSMKAAIQQKNQRR